MKLNSLGFLFSYKFLVIFIFLTVYGCKCPKKDILEQVNNGNTDPAMLITETWGTEIRNAFPPGDCLGTANFAARVEIEVRTALFDEATQSIVIDPNVYWEAIIPSQTFTNNTGFNNGTEITIEVPETGAYSIRYLVEISQCSSCCHGGSDYQCGSNQTPDGNNGSLCEAGFPRMVHEDVFLIAERPDHTINYFIGSSDFRVRMCVCGCDVSC